MKFPDALDPYALLNIPYSADGMAIQKAFQEKLDQGIDPDLLIRAYGMIRDPAGRNRFCWDSFNYCFFDEDPSAAEESIDIPALIKELAFCSSWELGDETCLD
jgi:hypothetical protein